MHRTMLVATVVNRFVVGLVTFALTFTALSAVFDTDNTAIYLFPLHGLAQGFLFCIGLCLTQITACLWMPGARPVAILPSWMNIPFMRAMTNVMSFRHAVHFSSAIHGDDTACVCCGKPLKSSSGGGLFLAQVVLMGNSVGYGMTAAAVYVFVHMDCQRGPGFAQLKSACEETAQSYTGTGLSFEHFLLEDPFVRQIPRSKYERLDEGIRSVIRKAGDNNRYHTKLAAECIILCNRLKADKTLGRTI